ncbi:MAG: Gar1/Naf1 family protein [Thermofilaceae archaeon]
MIPIGKIVKVTHNGKLIVKAEAIPKLGAEVHDASTSLVGYVDDIIGPVASPYIVVRASGQGIKQPEHLMNRMLYTVSVTKKLHIKGGRT